MFDPAVKSALVVLVAFLLNVAVKYLGIEVDLTILNALALAIVTWLLGVEGGARVAASLRGARG